MASPQELQTSAPLDSQSFQQFQTNDGSPVFNPMIPPSHPGTSLPPNPSSHVHAAMPPVYQSEIDHGHALSVSMEMSLSMIPLQASDTSSMEIVSATPVDRTVSQTILPDFTSHGSFGVDHRVNGLDGLDGPRQLASSPSATTSSTNVSHTSSPAMSGMASTYSLTSSSLASALDSMAASRSRSGSSASPPNLLSSASDLGFSSGNGATPASAHEAGFQYTLPFDEPSSAKENSPEQSGSSTLLVLSDMLKNIARTANSGSEACNMGSTTDAQQIVQALKQNVMAVVDLVAAMQLADVSDASTLAGLDMAIPQHINGLSTYSSSTSTLDSNAMLDASDTSRKRCASSVAGDRMLKAMKLEPQDDAPSLQISSSTGMHISDPAMASPAFSFASSMPSIPTSVQTISDMPSISAPVQPAGANSRPPSSAEMANHPPLGPIPGAEHQSHPLHTVVQYPSLEHVHQVMQASAEFVPPAPPVSSSGLPSTTFNPSLPQNMWGDNAVPVPVQLQAAHHHQHTLSSNPMLVRIPDAGVPIAGPSTLQFPPQPVYGSPTRATHMAQPSIPVPLTSSAIHPAPHHSVRSSRSSSFAHAQGEPHPALNSFDMLPSHPTLSGLHSSRASTPDYDDDMDTGHDSDENDYYGDVLQSWNGVAGGSEIKPNGDAVSAAGPHNHVGQRRMSHGSPSAEGGSTSSGHGNEVPQEYRAEVERIFFEFLNNICSNLDATDAKGEPIHQTLMAKKMQRLDESPDFRPFKFRIQAFTNAFLEELARQGYPEEKIPMKKIRNFLWNQPYISRFNEDGKKSKSKGNHIWHVDAKKTEGGWMFRPFKRRLAGTPPGVAYVGLRWSWQPRIWDPQASRANMPVQYSSPSLPSWLSWKDEVLSGIPTPDAQSCDVTVEARFIQDGKEELLTHTVHVTIAPMASVDASFTPSRRPSLVGDVHNPRRVMSDSVVAQTAQPRILRAQSTLAPAQPLVAPDSQVVQVLTTAAQRVAQEAQSQVVASPNDVGPELQALAKQQHVLTVTAQAFSSKIAAESLDGAGSQSNALTAAAQQVVLQAARQVAADRTVVAMSSGISPSQSPAAQVTVKDVSVATQSAVAQAVDMVGPLSSEVDVLMTASSLLQQQTRAPLPPASIMDSQLASADVLHATGATPPGSFKIASAVASAPSSIYFP
ncbi:uncharacterized protein LAESUDRAFT_747079 [Laetiporus sulphureus 93-53]|uniref:Uncharacterized protein n=1 Tax=Laetiporus sulphureus 93-53 TaxID=1314785 RepID=A0A165H761_9APHY|nr:uncharacterized protein LAESUDRAFT_747079 [Laetiporus sulphureus 93-53]KZT11338.1 hypothetical protein LAESUDRAFT_747079 [Laetiporus sulphureus 93-53]